MSEYDEQLTVFEYAHGLGGNLEPRLKMLHPIENTKGAGRPPAGAAEAAGVPDMFLAVPVSPFHGLYIELKKPKGYKISKNQLDWQKRLRAMGFASEICIGADKAIDMLHTYLDGLLAPF